MGKGVSVHPLGVPSDVELTMGRKSVVVEERDDDNVDQPMQRHLGRICTCTKCLDHDTMAGLVAKNARGRKLKMDASTAEPSKKRIPLWFDCKSNHLRLQKKGWNSTTTSRYEAKAPWGVQVHFS